MEKFSENYRLTYNMIDRFDRLSLCAMMDLFQDVASLHAIKDHNSFNELKQKQLFWVVTRMKVMILENDFNLDLVKAITWHNKSTRFDVNRQLLILQDEKEKVRISSKWVVIDAKSRKPSSMQDVFKNEVYDTLEYAKLKKISPFEKDFQQDYSFVVEASMIDRNLHMNNSQYAIVICNALKLAASEVIKSFEIDFLKELKYLEVANIRFFKAAKTIYIEIYSGVNIINARAIIELK